MAWRHRILIAAPLIGMPLLLLVSPDGDGPTFCPFALCTGTACPGCGMTRAASALVRGDLDLAMTLHPVLPLVILQLAVGWGWYLLEQSGRVAAPHRRLVNWSLIGTGLVLVAVWVARLAAGSLPPV